MAEPEARAAHTDLTRLRIDRSADDRRGTSFFALLMRPSANASGSVHSRMLFSSAVSGRLRFRERQPPPPQHIDAANRILHGLDDSAQHGVASLMSVAIVDVLKVIQIHHQQREGA